MAIAHEFEYAKPRTLDEAVRALAGHGEGARVLAGGTDLVGWLRDGIVAPGLLVDLKGIDGLKGIDLTDGTLSIGALATFTDIIESAVVREEFPLIHEMARGVASVGIRNRATMVGNICSAVPSCDSGPVLLVHDAEVRVKGPGGERPVPIAEWFVGPKKTSLQIGEIVTGLAVPRPGEQHGGCYVKLGRYRGEDLAQASVAVLALPGGHFRVAFGAVAPVPLRAPRIEAFLEGSELDDDLIGRAKRLIGEETSPIADIRASREYRVHMLPIMFERALRAAASRLAGSGPDYGTALL